MIRNIRLLGIVLGGLIGLALARPAGLLLVDPNGGVQVTPSGGVFLIAWIAAWMVVGFAILPYLTIVPARWLYNAVQQLSTAEFVTAVVGLLLGLLMGPCSGCRCRSSRDPPGRGCRSGSRSSLGWGWSG